jgi:starch synthase (maltosyl-transferring)
VPVPSADGAEEITLPSPPEGRGFYQIVIEGVKPSTPSGYPAKGLVGEAVSVRADIFRHGHDILAARALLYCGGQLAATGPLKHQGNDLWTGLVGPPVRVGAHRLVVEAWTDRYATWAHKTALKLAARQSVAVEIDEGAKLLEEWSNSGGHDQSGRVSQALRALSDASAEEPARVNAALSSVVAHLLAGPLLARDLTRAEVALWVDRERAGVGAWYEIFPRSFGGLQGAAAQVPRIAGLGFDVLYMPPIHPIGRSYRKGRNNTLEAGPNDPGSPYAIGAAEGGHLAIHPELGTLEDFEHLVRTASEHGMEIALDYALNCSPDHPWVSEHPEWFHHRPDGSIAYAENPPKKYQDIYPLNMFPDRDEDREALWQASKEIFDFWSDRGVRIFRVDNPHTKPFSFWEWCIGELRREKPDLVFLAEAFTRPKVMARLAEIGFSQSYTYFTWRTEQYGPEGLRTYVDELAQGPTADYMRPNFWPTTPDILSGPLRNGPPAAFALRYVLAATLSPSYGIYGGYELYENEPLSADNEDFMWSEKFEIRHRDFSRPGSLAPLFSAVNRVRRAHPAFSRLRTTHFHGTDNPNVMVYSKTSELGGDVVLVVVTLDPYSTQESTLHLNLPALGLTAGSSFEVRDELSGDTYTWGAHPYVRLDPYRRVAHIMSLPGSGLE